MKKRTIAAALALCLACCCLCPMTAFAAEDQTSASTSVLYSVQGGYTVNIPASVNLNNDEKIEITASELKLASGKDLVVRINSNSFDEEGNFLLKAPGGASIQCDVMCSGPEGAGSSFIWHDGALNNPVVATFDTYSALEGSVYRPTSKGYLAFEVNNPGLVAGDYTGNLNFVIGLEDHVNG